MKILIVHARYALAGGEERVVEMQDAVLTARGHEVVRYEEANAEVAAQTVVWSRRARRNVAALIASERPDVVHVHNQFPAVSPSVYAAANAAGVPVVQHLHNARLVCVQPFLLRDGRPCHDCVGRSPLPGVVHRCYRNSLPQSAVAGGVQMLHRALGTWHHRVDAYAAVSESLARVMRASGVVPPGRIVVCPNGIADDPGVRSATEDQGYALFVGRLSIEKGADTVVRAAARAPDVPFILVGDGPERARLESAARGMANVSFTGHVEPARVFALLRSARALLAPSRGQEPFGMTVVEAAAVGVPAIVANRGALPEIVEDGVTGFVVPPDDADQIVDALARVRPEMGAAARRRFEREFCADAWADRLLALYGAYRAP